MKPTIRNLPREAAEAFVPGPYVACISITQPGEPAHLDRRFVATLRLAFSDWDCDRYGKLPAERMNPALIHYFAEWQAKAIKRFVELAVERDWHLVVHCDAGVSRSGAVVDAILRAFPDHFEDKGWSRFPNNYVRRLILREFGVVPSGLILADES